MFCLSVKGILNVVGPVRCMRETSGTLSRNHSVSSRGIERLGTVRPERVLPETRRLPLMVEEEVMRVLFEDLLSLSTRGQCDTFHKVMRISVFLITVLVTHCRDRRKR